MISDQPSILDIQTNKILDQQIEGHRVKQKRKVLIIDDDVALSHIIRLFLEQEGYQVVLSSDATEGLAALQQNLFDIAVVDYVLPGLNGLDVLEQIKILSPELPAIILTGAGNEEVAVKALKRGAFDYIVKGLNWEKELKSAIKLAFTKVLKTKAEKRWRSELNKRATTDALTGLYNRSELERITTREVMSAKARAVPLAFALMDLDGFKLVNDTKGHIAGDEILCRVASLLDELTGSSGYPARWGGDEFAVVLPAFDFEEARLFWQKALQGINSINRIAGFTDIPRLTASAGIVVLEKTYFELAYLLRYADNALYAAKNAGKCQVKFFMM